MAPLKLHGYQDRAVEDLLRDPNHALYMDPGLGKTAIELTAFAELRDQLDVSRALIVAPLRVCHTVWPSEVEKWTPRLRIQYIGDLTADLGSVDADIVTINPERVGHLFGARAVRTSKKSGKDYQFFRAGPWKDWRRRPEMLIIDESTKFKKSSGTRTRTVKRYLGDFGRRTGMTGTPTPNGLIDLHGQMLLIDGGAALGANVGDYEERYFDGIVTSGKRSKGQRTIWRPKHGAFDKIMRRIAPRVTVLRDRDWLNLPQLIEVDVHVDLPAKVRKALDELRAEGSFAVDDFAVVTGGPARERQLINGLVYNQVLPGQRPKDYTVVHQEKLNALVDLIDQIGKPTLVAYEFVSERVEIIKRLKREGKRIAELGRGVGAAREIAYMRAWDAGDIDVMVLHPDNPGLNIQAGGHHLIWFCPTWNLEHYQQLYRRLLRQGQLAEKVFVHRLMARGTVDVAVGRVLCKKDATQEDVFDAIEEYGQ